MASLTMRSGIDAVPHVVLYAKASVRKKQVSNPAAFREVIRRKHMASLRNSTVPEKGTDVDAASGCFAQKL